MSIGDCPNYPACNHTSESQCDADICGDRTPIMTKITIDRAVLQQALDALEKGEILCELKAAAILRAALAQPDHTERSLSMVAQPDAIAANKLRRAALDIQARNYHSNILAEQMLAMATQIRTQK